MQMSELMMIIMIMMAMMILYQPLAREDDLILVISPNT
jgi:hypothetical protein